MANKISKKIPHLPIPLIWKNSVNSVKISVASHCRPQDKSEGRPGFPKRPSLFWA
jgi:hypothetical protein